jgi:hypothetical protein
VQFCDLRTRFALQKLITERGELTAPVIATPYSPFNMESRREDR